MPFTTEEMNLICIFHSGGRLATLVQLREALPDFDDADMLNAADRVMAKLGVMGDDEYDALYIDTGAPIGFAEEYNGAGMDGPA